MSDLTEPEVTVTDATTTDIDQQEATSNVPRLRDHKRQVRAARRIQSRRMNIRAGVALVVMMGIGLWACDNIRDFRTIDSDELETLDAGRTILSEFPRAEGTLRYTPVSEDSYIDGGTIRFETGTTPQYRNGAICAVAVSKAYDWSPTGRIVENLTFGGQPFAPSCIGA